MDSADSGSDDSSAVPSDSDGSSAPDVCSVPDGSSLSRDSAELLSKVSALSALVVLSVLSMLSVLSVLSGLSVFPVLSPVSPSSAPAAKFSGPKAASDSVPDKSSAILSVCSVKSSAITVTGKA